MAFNTNAQPSVNTAPRGDRNGQNDSWKAQGFINFYLPTKGGKKRKLGFIPLYEKNANEAALMAWIQEDPEARVKLILSRLEIDFRTAEADPNSAFDLEIPEAPAAKAKK